MELSYVSGAISADTPEAIESNVRAAAEVAARVAERGYAVFCPHTNSHWVTQALENKGLNDSEKALWMFWMQIDLEILKRCDLLITVPGWEKSKGACIEVEWAYKHHVRVYHFPYEMPPIFSAAALLGRKPAHDNPEWSVLF